MFRSTDASPCFPLPSSGFRGRSFRKRCGSPPWLVLRGRKTARPSSVALRNFGRTRMLPSPLLTASAYAISTDFRAESSRPASLLCTLRTHQSPGEWQHSLPACSLALAGRDFHPLDFFKWFPPPSLLVSPPPRFSQRDRSPSEN